MPHNNNFLDLHDKLEISHALLSSVCAFFLVPAALITARYMRNNPVWYKIHWILNVAVTLIITACFVMGVKSINGNQIGGKKSDTHHRFGLVAFFLVVTQTLIGIAVHFTRAGGPPPGLPAPGKHWSRYFHAFMGICTAGTLFAAIYSGMHEWTKSSDDGTVTPTAIRVVFWILLGAIIIPAYFLGFYFRRGTWKGKGPETKAAADASEESVEEKDRDAIEAA
ncbi:hypothetical protein DACRYDRAFT_23320 [Dacryopinax primogenitus]|uniref:Cytochrome b561 domain-containing protein n=1 Tax=Dacryopinax primogenitus (strain DJM 731) TaxID=1858805 RepID=M5FXC8_DACPD|nr:uncharacterized protein DACRYDRAFT_23320 [Dacryopinax primogenitus]EJU00430.1 hypothetical protein DACRYDRAFT_23320 [Dacryopinax primogenitus]